MAATRRPRIAGAALIALVALVAAACAPKPAPPPPPPPPTVSCTTGATRSEALEQCHLKYRAYTLDSASSFAEDRASYIAARITQGTCASTIGWYHVSGSTLLGAYPGSSAVAENLHCHYYSGTTSCSSPTLGATKAMNAWLASPGHKANLDAFAGKSVNAAAACSADGVYVAVAQFHNP